MVGGWVVGGWVGWWVAQKKTKIMLYSTLVEIEIEVEVELGKKKLPHGVWLCRISKPLHELTVADKRIDRRKSPL